MLHYYLRISTICEDIEHALFDILDEYSNKMLQEIIDKNNVIKEDVEPGFQYRACFYFIDPKVEYDKYRFPELDDSLVPNLEEYVSFMQEWSRKRVFVMQFIKRILLSAVKPTFDPEYRFVPESEEIDLGCILPDYLLRLTKLFYTKDIYREYPPFSTHWRKTEPIINEILALRMVLN